MTLRVKRIIFIWLSIVSTCWGMLFTVGGISIIVKPTEKFKNTWYFAIIFLVIGLAAFGLGFWLLQKQKKMKLEESSKDKPQDAKPKISTSWIIFTFIPWINGTPWLYIGIKTKIYKYFIYSFLYSIPFLASFPFMEQGPDALPWWLLLAAIISLVIGIAHSQMHKDQINASLKAAEEKNLLAAQGEEKKS